MADLFYICRRAKDDVAAVRACPFIAFNHDIDRGLLSIWIYADFNTKEVAEISEFDGTFEFHCGETKLAIINLDQLAAIAKSKAAERKVGVMIRG